VLPTVLGLMNKGILILLSCWCEWSILLLAVIIQMGHDTRDKVSDCWSTNTMKCKSYLHVLHFETSHEAHMNCDRLWELRTLSDLLNDLFAKFYNPSEHLAVDEVMWNLKEGWFSNSMYLKSTNVLASQLVTAWATHTAWEFV
jgi:hypothetical protein